MVVARRKIALFVAIALFLASFPLHVHEAVASSWMGRAFEDARSIDEPVAMSSQLFVGDGFTVETVVHSSGNWGHNSMFVVTNTSNEEWPHWVLSMNRPLGLNEPTAWGESWQNNGLFVHQDASETTIRNLGHQAPVMPGESVEIHTYSNSQQFYMPTDFRLRVAERRLVPLQDRTYEVLVHSEWGNNFNHAISIVNTSNRVIQNWEIQFDVLGGGMSIDSAPNAQIVQTTSGSAILLYVPGGGQVLHPGQNLHMGMIGTFVPGSSITNVRIYERIGTAYGGWPDFVPDQPGTTPPPWPTPHPTPSPYPTPEPSPEPTPTPTPDELRRHGVERSQIFAYELGDLIPPTINNVNFEILDFIAGVYRISISGDDCTLDPRAMPIFFWASSDGTFDDVVEYCCDSVSFTFSANPGTGERNAYFMLGVGDSLGQAHRVTVGLKGHDEFDGYRVFDAHDTHIWPAEGYAPLMPIAFSDDDLMITLLPYSGGTPQGAYMNNASGINISFVLDTSAAMNHIDPNVQIPQIFAELPSLAPFNTFSSVVARGNVFTLAEAPVTSTALRSIVTYGGYANPSELLSMAGSSLVGGDKHNVIVFSAGSWDSVLIEQARQMERRGFTVYLVIHEPDDETANQIRAAHRNVIVYSDVSELPGLMREIPLFSSGFISPMAATSLSFSDLSSSRWSYPAIGNMTLRGAINGFPDGTFHPGRHITLQEFLVMTIRLTGVDFPMPDGPTWASYFIEHAFATIPGLQDGGHVMTADVSQDLAAYIIFMVLRSDSAAGIWSRVRYLAPFRTASSPFEDWFLIPNLYRQAVLSLYQRDIITGTRNRQSGGLYFHPTNSLTRENAAVWLFNAVTPPGSDALSVFNRIRPSLRAQIIADSHPLSLGSNNRITTRDGAGVYSFTVPRPNTHPNHGFYYTFTATDNFAPLVYTFQRHSDAHGTYYTFHPLRQAIRNPVGQPTFGQVRHNLRYGEEVMVAVRGRGSRLINVNVDHPMHCVRRGTALEYLEMQIGWPLGYRDQYEIRYVNGQPLRFGVERRSSINHISSWYGPRPDYHPGIDINRQGSPGYIVGSPVLAVTDGVVEDVITSLRRYYGVIPVANFGYTIAIRSNLVDPATGHYLIFTYMHLQYAPTLAVGDHVFRGQVLGYVGNSGTESRSSCNNACCDGGACPGGGSCSGVVVDEGTASERVVRCTFVYRFICPYTGAVTYTCVQRSSSGHLHFEVSNSGETFEPSQRRERITYRINPGFFYPEDSFIGNTSIWVERRANCERCPLD